MHTDCALAQSDVPFFVCSILTFISLATTHNTKQTHNPRISFASTNLVADYPDFLDVQLNSFKDFFQIGTPPEDRTNEGLYKVFKENFPITDTKGNFTLEFIDYAIEPPKYSPDECMDRGVTYAAPLKATLRLSCNDQENEDFDTVEQTVFLGELPQMTDRGSFIVNGVERVIVSQIHRSPGVFFAQNRHTSGAKLYSARIIPFRGSWIEFATDVNDVMHVYIDRKKKFPITILLRAIGFGTDKEILDIFDLAEEVKTTKTALKSKIGAKLAARVLKSWTEEFVDEETGEVISINRNEVLLERDTVLDEDNISIVLDSGMKTVLLHKETANASDFGIIYNTFHKDDTNSEREAIEHMYRQLRNTEPPDEQTARETVQSIFFSDRRYKLGEVGRYRINKKLGIDVPSDVSVLTKQDIIEIVKYLIGLINSKATIDDIDHLSNRRIRVVGEQLKDQFGVGLARMVRTVRERMNVRDSENYKPTDLINARILSSVINAFFGTNPLSQFMDKVNPLTEVAHKRRISALGPGGLSRDRAGFEVRDVHYTHYGRLCTIETPEGPNIGLISSLCVHAKVNNMGFIETPYRKVKNGKVAVNEPIVYLTAEEEGSHNIAQANVPIKKDGTFHEKKIKARLESDFLIVGPDQLSYVDVAPNQIVSVAASLIPFLEHDDASRALMGSNMQRQAVPLIEPQAPIVGTGLEERVARDFRGLVYAEKNGVVTYVDANTITVKYDQSEEDDLLSFEDPTKTYTLSKLEGTNQETCVRLRPVVLHGEVVKKGQLLCEGYATDGGELALGRNLKVAFMTYKGYNFEDAIVISEKVVKEDVFTSIHIETFEMEVRNTKLGEEELTSEIPNVSEDAIRNLDENGIISVGSKVKEGDILIGKIAPKGETDPTPEEKLLRAIFGDKAHDVKDVSLKAPPSLRGVVVDTKLFSRLKKDRSTKAKLKKEVELLIQSYRKKLGSLDKRMIEKLTHLLNGKKCLGVFHKFGDEIIPSGVKFSADLLQKKLFSSSKGNDDNDADQLNECLIQEVVLTGWIDNEAQNDLLKIIVHNYKQARSKLIGEFKRQKFGLEVGDELPVGILRLAKVYIAKKRKLKVGDKMAGRHGNKGVVANIVREEDMPFLEDGTPVDIVLNPLGVPSRMNLGQLYETVLGWAGLKLGKKYATPIFDGASIDDISNELNEANLPAFGRTTLYNGITGEKFDQKVTVGVIYMLKLNHLVDDKMHARSIGPYSLITQQPLGGKAKFGGQRFGEMEVWALHAFGAAYNLRDMLTTKSDDTVNRARAYESIVKGNNIPEPGLPESFNVLVHQLRGLGIELTLR